MCSNPGAVLITRFPGAGRALPDEVAGTVVSLGIDIVQTVPVQLRHFGIAAATWQGESSLRTLLHVGPSSELLQVFWHSGNGNLLVSHGPAP